MKKDKKLALGSFGPLRRTALFLAMALLVSACRGGDDCAVNTGGQCFITQQEYTDEVARVAEDLRSAVEPFRAMFSNQWGLSTVRAARAYANLHLKYGNVETVLPGDGAIVGVMDTGIDHGHEVFANTTIHDEIFLDGAKDEVEGEFDPDGYSHGTAVASVVAGDGIGIAPGADLVAFALPLGSGGRLYIPISLAGLNSVNNTYEGRFRRALNWRSDDGRKIDFLNLSFGFSGIIEDYTEQQLRDNFGDAIAVMAQAGVTDKTVLVWAAGNAHGDDCQAGSTNLCVNRKINARSVEILAGLPARIEELRGHVVAVAAIGENGKIASFSNRCGIAKDWCLAAPGVSVRAAYFGDYFVDGGVRYSRGYASLPGTSFAAPYVAGGLAVMKHMFRDQLSNTQLLSRMLDTADDTGIYANADIYGHGLMDLGAATSPVGGLSFSLGDQVAGDGIGLSTSALALGGAFGDGLAFALSGQEIAAFDALGAPFWFDLGGFAAAGATGPSEAARLRALMVTETADQGFDGRLALAPTADMPGTPNGPRLQFGMFRAATVAESGHLSFADHGLAVALSGRNGLSAVAFTTEGADAQAPVSGAALSWQAEGLPVALRAGWLSERRTLLGSAAKGAFGGWAANTVFAGFAGGADFGDWRLAGSAEIGMVTPDVSRGVVRGMNGLVTSTFGLHATRRLSGDSLLQVSLSQPLRVESGRAALSVPVGRTPDGGVLRRSFGADLEPTGRQVDLGIHWRQGSSLLRNDDLRLSAVLSHQPGHRGAAKPDVAVLAGWRLEF